MQQKLKAVFRSASRKQAPSDQVDDGDDARSPRSTLAGCSLDEQRRRQSGNTHRGGAQHNGRNHPLSSPFHSRRLSAQFANGYTQSSSSNIANDAIANEYRSYIAGLSHADKTSHGSNTTLGGDRQLITGEGERRYEEDVADRNIDRSRSSFDVTKRKPLPAAPALDATNEHSSRNGPDGAAFSTSKSSTNPPQRSQGYSLGEEMTRGGLKDSIRPHVEDSPYVANHWKGANWPSRSPRGDIHLELSRRKPRGSESEEFIPRKPPNNFGSLPLRPKSEGAGDSATVALPLDSSTVEQDMQQLLDGAVELRDTVDADKDVTWAPGMVNYNPPKFVNCARDASSSLQQTYKSAAVTQEVVKTHEHEIIKHKIFREIHNYEHHHYEQPVYDTEVLPPRHWIPNPNGDGLVEISASELPSCTGNKRRWKIVLEEPKLPKQPPIPRLTEPRIIEHPAYIMEEGFEHSETTTIYPPTLADLTDYSGLVQPVHFDHKTGKRWLGPMSTMHQLRVESGAVADPVSTFNGLPETPSKTPGLEEALPLLQSLDLKRREAHVHDCAERKALGKHDGVAVAK